MMDEELRRAIARQMMEETFAEAIAAGASETKAKAAAQKAAQAAYDATAPRGALEYHAPPDITTLSDLIECLRLRQATYEATRSPGATDGDHAVSNAVTVTTKGYQNAPYVQDVRAICNARYGAELTLEAVTQLRGHYCESAGKSVDEADATPLVDVVAELRKQVKPPAATTPTSGDWLTVSEAAELSGVHRATIHRALRKIKHEGSGDDVRIDSADFNRWQLARSRKPDPQESDATVRRKLQQAEDDDD